MCVRVCPCIIIVLYRRCGQVTTRRHRHRTPLPPPPPVADPFWRAGKNIFTLPPPRNPTTAVQRFRHYRHLHCHHQPLRPLTTPILLLRPRGLRVQSPTRCSEWWSRGAAKSTSQILPKNNTPLLCSASDRRTAAVYINKQ